VLKATSVFNFEVWAMVTRQMWLRNLSLTLLSTNQHGQSLEKLPLKRSHSGPVI